MDIRLRDADYSHHVLSGGIAHLGNLSFYPLYRQRISLKLSVNVASRLTLMQLVITMVRISGVFSGVAFIFFLTLIYQCRAAQDLEVITLSISNNATIVKASATLILPIAPPVLTGALALWSGILLDKDFIQGVSENSPDGLGYCIGLEGNWCNIPYALTPNVTYGPPVIEAPFTRIRTDYIYNPFTSFWDQTIFVNDQLATNLSTSPGQRGKTFYIAMECAGGICPPAPAHRWENMSITLSKPNLLFKHLGGWSYNATGGQMSTPDGGLTWLFSTLYIPSTPVSP
ncbi:hypothetical protein F5Y17DRAFT_450350 [Xylariaceae sp. FL0594]|nr:hypothetical protein F5Y17DRAFT_450350 [Xylariaceae sp. FL0594]